MRLYAQSATTVTSFEACNSGGCTRLSAKASAGASSRPLSMIERTEGAIRSRKVDAPGSAQANRMVLVEVNVGADRSAALPRSSETR